MSESVQIHEFVRYHGGQPFTVQATDVSIEVYAEDGRALMTCYRPQAKPKAIAKDSAFGFNWLDANEWIPDDDREVLSERKCRGTFVCTFDGVRWLCKDTNGDLRAIDENPVVRWREI